MNDHFIRIFEDTLPVRFCEELIRRFDVCPDVIEGKVGVENGPLAPDVRSCLELNINKTDSFQDMLQFFINCFSAVVMKYKAAVPEAAFLPEQFAIEHFRMKRYRAHGENSDYFKTHVDVNSHATARRFLVCFFYLNTVDEGGETMFPHLGLKIKPQQGNALCFPPSWMFPHSGESPISNDKYICGSYLHYL